MPRHASIRWIVAALLVAASIAPIASWWLLLESNRSIACASFQLEVVFAPTNPDHAWTVAWAVLPAALIAGAVLYSSPFAVRRAWAWFLAAFLAGITLFCIVNMPAVGVFLIVPFGLAVWWAMAPNIAVNRTPVARAFGPAMRRRLLNRYTARGAIGSSRRRIEARAACAGRVGAPARVSHGHVARDGCRQAAEPREERNGRVVECFTSGGGAVPAARATPACVRRHPGSRVTRCVRLQRPPIFVTRAALRRARC